MPRKKIPGHLYQRKESRFWWWKYRGQYFSTETEERKEAETFALRKAAEISTHTPTGMVERVRMDQLFDLMLADWKRTGKRSLTDLKSKLSPEMHLRKFWGSMKAIDVGTRTIDRYVDLRKTEDASNATVNRELSVVRRALKLGYQHEPPLVQRVPFFTMLKESTPRQGMIEPAAYRAVRDLLPGYARIALVIAYHTGARRGEIAAIQVRDVDLSGGRILLRHGQTKSGEPRYLPIYGDMRAELEHATAAADRDCPWLIQADGRRIQEWRKSWETACDAAGVRGTLFHDLRRTALTNMIEAGLSETDAMQISGHKTRAVFERYLIQSNKRLAANAAKMEAHLLVTAGVTEEPESVH